MLPFWEAFVFYYIGKMKFMFNINEELKKLPGKPRRLYNER